MYFMLSFWQQGMGEQTQLQASSLEEPFTEHSETATILLQKKPHSPLIMGPGLPIFSSQFFSRYGEHNP